MTQQHDLEAHAAEPGPISSHEPRADHGGQERSQPHYASRHSQGADRPMLIIAVAGVVIAAAAIVITTIFTVSALEDKRNAALVQIGIGVLRVDPAKNPQMAAAREWAINLIDANAGGIKFSAEASAELLKKPLGYDDNAYSYDGYDYSVPDNPRLVPKK